MKKLIGATAVCALAIGIAVAPAGAVPGNGHGQGGQGQVPKGAKQVPGTVSVNVTPTTITSTTTGVTASGNVSATSSCRKDRTVRFAYVNGTTVTSLPQTAVTGPNGDYTASLPKPTDTNPPTSSVTLRATVDQAFRKVGGKKKGKRAKRGRQFNCMEITGQSSAIAIAPAVPAT
jgi:hypothetical protein